MSSKCTIKDQAQFNCVNCGLAHSANYLGFLKNPKNIKVAKEKAQKEKTKTLVPLLSAVVFPLAEWLTGGLLPLTLLIPMLLQLTMLPPLILTLLILYL